VQDWLQEQLATHRVDDFFGAIERMSVQDDPLAISPEEIAAEIEALRAQQLAWPQTPIEHGATLWSSTAVSTHPP
jgi:hypothetical protein